MKTLYPISHPKFWKCLTSKATWRRKKRIEASKRQRGDAEDSSGDRVFPKIASFPRAAYGSYAVDKASTTPS